MKITKQNKMDSQITEIISNEIFLQTMEIQQDYGLITVNTCKLAPDLSYIDVYVSSIKNQDILCKTLAQYAQEIKYSLNKKIILRKIPIIRFRYDDSMQKENDIISKIQSLDIPKTSDSLNQ